MTKLGLGLGVAAAIVALRILTSKTSIAKDHPDANAKDRDKKGALKAIGETPLLDIPSLSSATGVHIKGKAEFLNLGGSPKDRLALALIQTAEENGSLRPGHKDIVVEGTVGSTGISLATVCAAKGYRCHIIMPDDQAKEKYALLKALGATVEAVPQVPIVHPSHFVNLARKRAAEWNATFDSASEEYQKTLPRAVFCDQFENPSNVRIHYTTTGPEIHAQCMADHKGIDAFVMGAGTGGTLSGVGSYLKSVSPSVQIILADPQGSGLSSKVRHGVLYSPTDAEGSRRRHQVDTVVEGIGSNRLTSNFTSAYNAGLIDDAVSVSDQEAVDMSRFLLRRDGLFLGSSSAVHCVAAYKYALKSKMAPGSTLVTLLCDSGTRHLTKFWSDEYLIQTGLVPRDDPGELHEFISL